MRLAGSNPLRRMTLAGLQPSYDVGQMSEEDGKDRRTHESVEVEIMRLMGKAWMIFEVKLQELLFG